jgi:hypothetical protein
MRRGNHEIAREIYEQSRESHELSREIHEIEGNFYLLAREIHDAAREIADPLVTANCLLLRTVQTLEETAHDTPSARRRRPLLRSGRRKAG